MKMYRAVVEDNMDPLKNSRVRVRIFGLHTPNNENSSETFNVISSSDLPWAETMGGTDFGLVGGVGLSSVLRQGTWVWVVLDNGDPNAPVVVGTIKGTNKPRPTYKSGEGFNDKDEVHPIKARNDESDLNRLSRSDNLNAAYYDNANSNYNTTDTVHKKINDNVDVVSSVTDGPSGADVSQTEPNSTNDKTTYPNCAVLETPSGHVIEFDDTPGNERIRLYHTTGSYMEIKPDGTFVQKSVSTAGVSHYVHMSDVEDHIAKGVKRYVEKNIDEIVAGGIRRNVQMDKFSHVGGLFTILADGNLQISNDVKIVGSLQVTSKGTFGGNLTSQAEVSDSLGNLSSLRSQYDSHEHTNGPTSDGASQGPTLAHPADPKTRAADFTWASSPLGFK